MRLKISSAIDAFAEASCLVCDYTDESNQAFQVRAVVRGFGEKELFQHERPLQTGSGFVRDFDLGYAQRRLHFVMRGSWALP